MSALLILGLFSTVADAQNADDAQAKLLTEVKQHLNADEYVTSIRKMNGLEALSSRPVVLLNMTVAHIKWGASCREPIATYDRFFTACEI